MGERDKETSEAMLKFFPVCTENIREERGPRKRNTTFSLSLYKFFVILQSLSANKNQNNLCDKIRWGKEKKILLMY